MPYPDICPECENPFRNSGTHFTARRSEVGRHVLLELGCQISSQRYWWDFTAGKTTSDGKTAASARPPKSEARQLVTAGHSNGHVQPHPPLESLVVDHEPIAATASDEAEPELRRHDEPEPSTSSVPDEPEAATGAADLEQVFVRQLELDRLTLRQMRGWVSADDTHHSADVAASATEATYERLALALFGRGLAQIAGPWTGSTQPSDSPSAEERLAVQREKARIRARDRRATIKAARLAAS